MTTADRLFSKYGATLTEAQLADVLHMEPKTLANQRSAGAFTLQPIRWEGRRTPVWHHADVADWLDSMRAAIPAEAGCTAEAATTFGGR